MSLRSRFALPVLGLIPLVVATPAIAAEVIPKDGPCPSGYHAQGNYCVGNQDHPPAAVPKDGSCPSGYHAQGNYCVGNQDHPPAAVPKDGSCPSGYHAQGSYCVGNRR